MVLKSPQSVLTSIRKAINKPIRNSAYSKINSASDEGKKIYKKKIVKNASTESSKNTVLENRSLSVKTTDKKRREGRKEKEMKKTAIVTANSNEMKNQNSADIGIPNKKVRRGKKERELQKKVKATENANTNINENVSESIVDMNIPKIVTEINKKIENSNQNQKKKIYSTPKSTTNSRARRTEMRKDKSRDNLDSETDMIVNK